MKKILTGLVIIILLLDFAALDDITTSNEPSFTQEYLMLIFSAPVLLIVAVASKKL